MVVPAKMKNDSSINVQVGKSDEESNKVPEAVLIDIVRAYDKVDIMSLKDVIAKLKCFHLDTQGSENILRENLKTSYQKILLNGVDLSLSNDLLPYYVIIDFEATCLHTNTPGYRHEIIEFPAVLVNSRKQEIIDCFQMYCKPQINPILTEFCTELTGITQEQVDSAETFDKVIVHFQKWLSKHQLGSKHKFCVVTDGPFDMSRFLYSQCHYLSLPFPKWGTKWVNIRKAFCKFYKSESLGLSNMLEYLEMNFKGRLHCGLDDAKNIARILLRMIYDGACILPNERITRAKEHQNKAKGGNKSFTQSKTGEQDETKEETKNLRVEAHCKPVYHDNMPNFKRVKKERLIAEAKLARKILRNTKDMTEKS
ncbi:hypothetical protein RUM44_001201 [Polyplax serrata]|uniref:Exonuclease domain-containing protein n=1 Tax=Polyplax serrata TaxID=468196 RepID=A0ABR1B9Q7_POLSC